MGCLWESGLLDSWDPDDVATLQDMLRSLILATDITRQLEFLTRFRVSSRLSAAVFTGQKWVLTKTNELWDVHSCFPAHRNFLTTIYLVAKWKYQELCVFVHAE